MRTVISAGLYIAWLPVLAAGAACWPYTVRELRRERRHP